MICGDYHLSITDDKFCHQLLVTAAPLRVVPHIMLNNIHQKWHSKAAGDQALDNLHMYPDKIRSGPLRPAHSSMSPVTQLCIVETSAGSEPLQSLKFHNHKEGPY